MGDTENNEVGLVVTARGAISYAAQRANMIDLQRASTTTLSAAVLGQEKGMGTGIGPNVVDLPHVEAPRATPSFTGWRTAPITALGP